MVINMTCGCSWIAELVEFFVKHPEALEALKKMKCKQCDKKYEYDGRGNLCPKCMDKMVPKKYQARPKR